MNPESVQELAGSIQGRNRIMIPSCYHGTAAGYAGNPVEKIIIELECGVGGSPGIKNISGQD
jgi:hypothetical protein